MVQWALISARVEGGERRGGSGDQDESRREHRREVQRFVRVVDLKSWNEAIENANFQHFLGGHAPSLAGCKQPAAVSVFPPF